MLWTRFVSLIEKHSETLSLSLAEQISRSERTSDFRKIPPKELQLAATDVYRNLGEWLLQKTDSDIAQRFRAIAARRASEGISLHQFVWALMLTRDHLHQFLRQEGFADNLIALHGEIELHRLLTQFFDHAIYYAIQGYETAAQTAAQTAVDSNLRRAQQWAVSVGLISARHSTP
jgi:hypothetical protein